MQPRKTNAIAPKATETPKRGNASLTEAYSVAKPQRTFAANTAHYQIHPIDNMNWRPLDTLGTSNPISALPNVYSNAQAGLFTQSGESLSFPINASATAFLHAPNPSAEGFSYQPETNIQQATTTVQPQNTRSIRTNRTPSLSLPAHLANNPFIQNIWAKVTEEAAMPRARSTQQETSSRAQKIGDTSLNKRQLQSLSIMDLRHKSRVFDEFWKFLSLSQSPIQPVSVEEILKQTNLHEVINHLSADQMEGLMRRLIFRVSNGNSQGRQYLLRFLEIAPKHPTCDVIHKLMASHLVDVPLRVRPALSEIFTKHLAKHGVTAQEAHNQGNQNQAPSKRLNWADVDQFLRASTLAASPGTVKVNLVPSQPTQIVKNTFDPITPPQNTLEVNNNTNEINIAPTSWIDADVDFNSLFAEEKSDDLLTAFREFEETQASLGSITDEASFAQEFTCDAIPNNPFQFFKPSEKHPTNDTRFSDQAERFKRRKFD